MADTNYDEAAEQNYTIRRGDSIPAENYEFKEGELLEGQDPETLPAMDITAWEFYWQIKKDRDSPKNYINKSTINGGLAKVDAAAGLMRRNQADNINIPAGTYWAGLLGVHTSGEQKTYEEGNFIVKNRTPHP